MLRAVRSYQVTTACFIDGSLGLELIRIASLGSSPAMSTSETVPVEPGNRIQIPSEWVQALGLREQVVLNRTPEGILIRPQPSLSWDEFFAEKLVISSNKDASDEIEISKDDLLY